MSTLILYHIKNEKAIPFLNIFKKIFRNGKYGNGGNGGNGGSGGNGGNGGNGCKGGMGGFVTNRGLPTVPRNDQNGEKGGRGLDRGQKVGYNDR